VPAYSSDDPWSTNPRFPSAPSNNGSFGNAPGGFANGAPSNLSGSGMPKDWWKKQEMVKVTILGHQGFILNRYMVYEVTTEVSLIYFILYILPIV
jgi:sorting nexin-8